MNPERDPLAELAAAWRALPPPDPAASVDAPDDATRATIGWLRAAWRASAPASTSDGELPWRLRLQIARRRARPLVPWLAAAAALLLCVQLGERFLGQRPMRPPHAAPQGDAVGAVDVALQPVTLSADRMELRSGPVRLILLTPKPESNP